MHSRASAIYTGKTVKVLLLFYTPMKMTGQSCVTMCVSLPNHDSLSWVFNGRKGIRGLSVTLLNHSDLINISDLTDFTTLYFYVGWFKIN